VTIEAKKLSIDWLATEKHLKLKTS